MAAPFQTTCQGGCLSPYRFAAVRGGRGSVSLIVLVMMFTFITAALGIISMTQAEYRNSNDSGRYVMTRCLAEAGIDHIVWRLEHTPQWSTVSEEQDVALGNGVYYLKSLDTGVSGIKGVRVQGWTPNRTAANAVYTELYAEFGPVYFKPWSGAALGDQGVPVANGDTNSYNSNNGSYASGSHYQNGDVAINSGTILIGPNGNVQGRAYYPQGGTASEVVNGGTLTGGILQNPAVTTFLPIPAIPAGAIHIKPVTASSFVRTSDGVTEPTPIPAGTYVIDADGSGNSISMSGHDSLTFDGTSQTVLYLAGNASIGGNGLLNNSQKATDLLIYGETGCTSMTISGNGDFYGAVYAPQASITLNGGGSRGSVYGSLAGKLVSFNGNGTIIHYDEALRGLAGVITRYQINSWTFIR